MTILEQVFNPMAGYYERAMNRAGQRMALLNANLANVDTPGYQRKDIDFAIDLDGARESKPTTGGSLRPDGNGVDLEKEVVAIAETQLRYQVLSEFTSRYFSGLRTVIKEGR